MSGDAEVPRCGDTVLHRPSGERRVVAYADPETGDLSAWGWPDSLARISDCELLDACPDAEHKRWVRDGTRSGGRRAAHVRRLYGAVLVVTP